MKTPEYEIAEKCISLRKLSKQGISLSPAEHEFVLKMFKDYPKWYNETQERVFNETVPFGSDVRYKNKK